MRLLGLNDQEGLWSEKEEFWGNKPNGDFQRKCFKRDFLSFFQQRYISGKVLKRFSYKVRFMGKSSKSLLFFFKKDIEISKQSFNKQKYILLFSTRI